MPQTPRQRQEARRKSARNHKQWYGESMLMEHVADLVRIYAVEQQHNSPAAFEAFRKHADDFARFLNGRLRRDWKVVRKARSQRTIH